MLPLKWSESESEVVQSFPTLCNPVNCSLPGSSVHGIFQQIYWSELPSPPPGDLPQGWNLSLRRQILYPLSHWGSTNIAFAPFKWRKLGPSLTLACGNSKGETLALCTWWSLQQELGWPSSACLVVLFPVTSKSHQYKHCTGFTSRFKGWMRHNAINSAC